MFCLWQPQRRGVGQAPGAAGQRPGPFPQQRSQLQPNRSRPVTCEKSSTDASWATCPAAPLCCASAGAGCGWAGEPHRPPCTAGTAQRLPAPQACCAAGCGGGAGACAASSSASSAAATLSTTPASTVAALASSRSQSAQRERGIAGQGRGIAKQPHRSVRAGTEAACLPLRTSSETASYTGPP